MEYFLRYSTIRTKTNEIHPSLPKFPFKLISLVETVAQPPFSQCSLSPVQPSDRTAYRMLSLLFDTYDQPKTKNNFNETLKQTKLRFILSDNSLEEI